jgi:hypothetical protein
VECELTYSNVRRVLDPGRACQLAFRITGISYDWYRSTMGVIERGLGTSQSTGEIFGSTGNMPGSTDDKPGSTFQRRRQAWEHLDSQ